MLAEPVEPTDTRFDEMDITVRSLSRDDLHAEAAKVAAAFYGDDADLRWSTGVVRLAAVGFDAGGVPHWEMSIRCTTEATYQRHLIDQALQALS